MATEATTPAPQRRKPLRLILLILVGGLLLTLAANLIWPDLDFSDEDRVAVVRIEGLIVDSRQTVEQLKEFSELSTVKAIVIRIDSPGGGVVPSQEIYNAVNRIREDSNKTVLASMGTVAASGGYYIASATDRIIANPGTLTGSIGVIMELANLQQLFKKLGVESIVIKSGRYKDMASPFRKMTREDRAILQSVLDDVHAQFIDAVAEGRSLDVTAVRSLADGRIFTGRQAQEVKLVDELGDLEHAIRLAAEMAGIEGEPRVVEPRRRFSIREFIENRWLGSLPSFDLQPGVSLKYLMVF